jgi:hypothetical protein
MMKILIECISRIDLIFSDNGFTNVFLFDDFKDKNVHFSKSINSDKYKHFHYITITV